MNKYNITIFMIFLAISSFGQQAEHLGWQINTAYDEREPILSPDGRTLYFWRRLSPSNTAGIDDHGDIWYSRQLRDGRWAPARQMEYPLNSQGHDFVWQVGTRHDTLWMTQVQRGRRDPGIAYATRSRFGGWNTPQFVNVKGLISRGNCKDYFLTQGNILLLPNEGSDTYGGSDLYVALPINDTTWSTPINLGPVVNTSGDEDAPFLTADGKTLFFNSNGHGGAGDHDVFISIRLDDSWRRWSKPVNLGKPINTPAYDYDFRIAPDGKYAYWGSEYRTQGKGDIFRLDLTDCQLDVYPTGDQLLCEGDSIVLEAGFAYHPALSYQWYKNDKPIPGARERTLTVKENGKYYLKRGMGLCERNSQPQEIRFKPLPAITITTPADFLCEGDSVLLWSGRAKNLSYQWEKNGLEIPGANRPGYWAKGPGSYQVLLNDGECDFYSNPVTLDQIPAPEIFLPGDILPTSTASLPKWLWANQLKYFKGDYWVKDMVSDAQGNVFLLSLKKQGGRLNEYVSKFFSEGPLSYSKPVARTKDLEDRFLSVDQDGNMIIARGGNNTFLTKYRQDGSEWWDINTDIEQICGLGVDGVGYIYVYGRFNRMINLGKGPVVPAARGSMFLAKFSPVGNLEWVNDFPVDGKHPAMGNALHIDQQGNVYIAGGFYAIANFGEQILRAPIGGKSYFLARFGSRGLLDWATSVHVNDSQVKIHDIYVDNRGNNYFMIGKEIFEYNYAGEISSRKTVSVPDQLTHVRLVVYQDQAYLASYDEKSRKFDVGLVNGSGRFISLWNGGKGEKSPEHYPVMDLSPRGSIIVGGVSSTSDLPAIPLGQGKRAPIFISKFGKPQVRAINKPINLCEQDDKYLLTTDVRGVEYQWLKDGAIIPGATRSMLSIDEPGDYRVRIVGGSCENVSRVQRVIQDCDPPDEVPATPPPLVSTAPANPQPEDDPAPEIRSVEDPYENDVPELRRTPSGSPDVLDARKVYRQGDVRVRSRTLTIYVWDHEVLDQDTVSLNINGEWVLRDYCLQSEKKSLTYTFDDRSPNNFIILYANNLGLKPPNTASIMIDDGYRKRTVRLRSTLEDCGMLNIELE